MTGTASQCNKITEIDDKTSSMIRGNVWGSCFPLTFIDNIGTRLIISADSSSIVKYKYHLFNKILKDRLLFLVR